MTVFIYNKLKRHTKSDTDKYIQISLEKYFNTSEVFNIKRTPLGKPYIDSKSVFIGVTHTDDTLLIAMSQEQNFGIDAEDSKRNVERADKICKKFFYLAHVKIQKIK